MSDEESGDSSDESTIQLDFDFFSPTEIDYQAFHRLLIQLFQSDAEPLHLRDLADLIISQGHIGSTVKLDGEESDPLAVLSVVNMRVHADNPAVRAIRDYVLSKTSADPAFEKTLQALFSADKEHDVGLILSERLINMPVQIIPPMWKMLGQEVQAAQEGGQPFQFSHFLVVSRTYRAPNDEDDPMDGESAPPTKKSKKMSKKKSAAAAAGASMTYPYHEEDTLISQLSLHALDYAFTNALPREDGGFGLDMGGRVMLFEAGRFPDVVAALEREFPPPSAAGS
ncbi:hypothetical protein DACRYDRAFT_110355 [Dacryopinax primogenitus]|uniref:Protein BCP1 n=1 Tax=Dacryopinax primogenitus (strain DJM 731) TaxID=1858805 RepID=M5FU61_DACPD|nr:uncharacterized protein DACRYDRAFT_110355 [Dacryopinax primogenitus]EJT99029.1 hypothetical protein DACRYDRAFT_110355 [Dacryopinax primogenitus]